MSIMDEDVKEYMRNVDSAMIERIGKVLDLFESEMKVRNVAAASVVLYSLVEKTVHTILFGDSGIEEEMLVREAANMIHGYLFE
jgi:hypothetical protein